MINRGKPFGPASDWPEYGVDPWEALETAARAIPIDFGSITLVYQDGRLLDIVKETRVRVGAQRITE